MSERGAAQANGKWEAPAAGSGSGGTGDDDVASMIDGDRSGPPRATGPDGTGRQRRMSRRERQAAARAMDSPAKRARREAWERDRRLRRKHTVILMSALLGLLLIIVGVGAYGVYRAKQPPGMAVPKDLTKRTDGLSVAGAGPVTVEIFADYECPECRAFQSASAATLGQMVNTNQIRLVYHPMSTLDAATKTRYSTRAANSAVCAADLGMFMPYSKVLFAKQPDLHSSGLSDDQLIQMAGGVGIINPKFAQCVRAQRFGGWVAQETALARRHNITGTVPTVLVNGASLAPAGETPSVPELSTAVAQAFAAAQARQPQK